MSDSRALRRWLVFVALLRLLSGLCYLPLVDLISFLVYIGIAAPEKFRSNLFDVQPTEVTNLYGRTFATWTFLTCTLCIICSRNPNNQAIYGATLVSFLVAMVHFLFELFLFQTMSWKTAYIPIAIAGISSLWMIAGWNYYTRADNNKHHKE